MMGKVYGGEPTVLVVMDFETVMLGSVFRPWMPTEVCDQYDWIKCPERKADDDE